MTSLFNLHPDIAYFNSNGESISQWLDAHPSFYTLLLLQGGTMAVTALIWSQPIDINASEKKINRHIDNWRSFGSWIGTLFGVIGLSASLAYINNVTEFGVVFVRHIIVLLGILVTLCMCFIIYKIRILE
jgi:hypothetical protein